MIIISPNLHLYLGLFLTNKCAVFLQTSSVIQYDPKSLFNSEIQKLNVLSGSHWINSRSLEIPHQVPSVQLKISKISYGSDADLGPCSTANKIRQMFIGPILLLQISFYHMKLNVLVNSKKFQYVLKYEQMSTKIEFF